MLFTKSKKTGRKQTLRTVSLHSRLKRCPKLSKKCFFSLAGVTGPVLLFDEALVGFADNYPTSIDYLPWRVWIGIWLVIIGLLVAMFQGSVMVRYFTKFTKDIFAGLVALLFIFEAFNKLAKIFKAHPLMSIKTLCSEFGIILAERLGSEKWSVIDVNETKEIYFNNSDDYKVPFIYYVSSFIAQNLI